MHYVPFLMSLLLLLACTPLTEQQMVEREFRRGEYRAKYLDYRESCEAMGGNVIVHSRRRMNHDRMPELGDRYHCEIP